MDAAKIPIRPMKATAPWALLIRIVSNKPGCFSMVVCRHGLFCAAHAHICRVIRQMWKSAGHGYIQQILWMGALILVLGAPAFGATGQWTNLTSYKNVRRMCQVNDTVYMATSGGLLAVTDPNSAPTQWSIADGLGTNDLTDVIVDSQGTKWITGLGRLIRLDENGFRQYLFNDRENNPLRLYSIADDGNYLWIGLDTGLVFFDKVGDGGQVDRHYDQFGSSNPGPDVFDILLSGDSIYLATNLGLAFADRTSPATLTPPDWTIFKPSNHPDLTSDFVTAIESLDSMLFIGTPRGLFVLSLDSLGDSSFVEPFAPRDANISDLRIDNDTLFIYHRWKIVTYIDGVYRDLGKAGFPDNAWTGLSTGQVRWVGLINNNGIFYDYGASIAEYNYTGLPGNNVSDLTLDLQGKITAGFTKGSFATLDGGNWVRHGFLTNTTTRLITDSTGDRWAGTRGNGLFRIRNTDDTANFDETNSTLRGNSDTSPGSPEFVYITALATDGVNIFAAAYRARNGDIIAFAPVDALEDSASWDALGVSDGLTNDRPVSIDYYGGELAVGTEISGVYICRLGADPFDRPSGVCVVHGVGAPFYLISNTIRAVRYSPDGVLWVGTNFGLSRWDWGIDRYIDIDLPRGISSDITELEFDSRGNLWIGTRDGLAYREAATGQIQVFNTFNSVLVDNKINAITYDRQRSDLYVSTQSGITVISRLLGAPPSYTLDSIVAYPNPFVIRSDDDLLYFNHARQAEVQLFTSAGDLVRSLPINTAWDGRNGDGREVASGVYIFLVTDREGNTGRGKVLLVRP